MRVLPRMTVVEPADGLEMKKAVRAIAEHVGPVYLRVGREATPVVTQAEDEFELGKANIVRQGRDLTIVACGVMVAKAVAAAEELTAAGIEAEIINMHTIKPLDRDTLLQSVQKTGAVVTAEEHSVIGGLGSAVAEFLACSRPVPLRIIGSPDKFGICGTYEQIHQAFGLTAERIAQAAKEVLEQKKP